MPILIINNPKSKFLFHLRDHNTLKYLQSFPVSTSLENAGMAHVKKDEEIWINET